MRQTKLFTLTTEQQQIVSAYIPFADAIASGFANRPVDMNDLKQEAYLSLCYAVTTYKGINDATFETFLLKYIKGNLKHFIKHYSRTQILSIDDDDDDDGDTCDVETNCRASSNDTCSTETLPVTTVTTVSLSKYDEDEGNISFEETLPDPDSSESEEKLNYKLLAERLLSILNDRERKMVKCAYYMDCQSQIRLRVWQRFNLSKPRFYNIVNRAVLKMAEYAHNNHIESPFN